MDLIDEDEPVTGGGNAEPYSVSELSGAVKRTVEEAFGHVRVRGEIGRVSRPGSGHIYLDLKDDRASISGVIWKGQAARLSHRPEEGLEVIATGRLTTFPGQSKYQIVIEDIRPAGTGALMAQLEARRRKLAAEGLFDEGRKKAIPFLPEVIGVVTSPTGAVIRDILHRLRDRFPRKVLVWPVRVQGQGAADEVAAAIRGFDALTPGGAVPRPDLVIVARGGGSLEDLWAFNEEAPVRAAAECRIPLISAVGHETDTTLIDFAADWRAPTPTAAAERAVPVRSDLLAFLAGQDGRLKRALREALLGRRQRLTDLSRGLPRPEALLEAPRQRLDLAGARLPGLLRALAAGERARLSRAAGGLRPQALRAMSAEKGREVAALGGALGRGLRRSAGRERERLGRAATALDRALPRLAAERGRAFARVAPRLTPDAPARRTAAAREALEAASRRFARTAAADLDRRRGRLAELERLRATLGYEETLRRGYVVVEGPDGVMMRAEDARAAPRLTLRFADGDVAARPEDAPPAAAPRRRAKAPEGQGSLFDG